MRYRFTFNLALCIKITININTLYKLISCLVNNRKYFCKFNIIIYLRMKIIARGRRYKK